MRVNRREFLQGAGAGTVLSTAACGAAGSALPATAHAAAGTQALPILANDAVAIYESPDPNRIFAYSPGLAVLPSGRLVATMDQGGPGMKDPDVPQTPEGKRLTGRIYTSDDGGKTWTHRADMPLIHARPFAAGDKVYVLGHSGDLGIMCSRDGGISWEGAFWLTQGEHWHQAPCNVHYTKGQVYLVMEVSTGAYKGWGVSRLAPVVLRGKETDDLTVRENWTFSNRYSFQDALAEGGTPNLIGVPFFRGGNDRARQRPPG